MSRSTDAQKAERLNAAHRLLARGQSVGEAALSLSRQFTMSRRQAYRYIEEAQLIGRPVPVVETATAVTDKAASPTLCPRASNLWAALRRRSTRSWFQNGFVPLASIRA